MSSSNPPFQTSLSFNEPKTQSYEARGTQAEFTTGEPISNTKTSNVRRRRAHSACSYVPRHIMAPVISEAASPRDTQASQDVVSAPDTGFVGLQRRKNSFPSSMVLKPDQFLEGGRVELAKREVNLEKHMPVFSKEPGAVKKGSTTPLTRTEVNGWMFENTSAGDQIGVNKGPRQRRISLPVLKIDKTDSSPVLQSCKSASSGELNNNLLSPPSIPQVRSGTLVGKKTKARQWSQSS